MSEHLRHQLSNMLEAHLYASDTAQYLEGVMTQIAALGADAGRLRGGHLEYLK
jgi:hypothetical protein